MLLPFPSLTNFHWWTSDFVQRALPVAADGNHLLRLRRGRTEDQEGDIGSRVREEEQVINNETRGEKGGSPVVVHGMYSTWWWLFLW